nr:hypothetical protein [Sphingosinicella sp. BN140058]
MTEEIVVLAADLAALRTRRRIESKLVGDLSLYFGSGRRAAAAADSVKDRQNKLPL